MLLIAVLVAPAPPQTRAQWASGQPTDADREAELLRQLVPDRSSPGSEAPGGSGTDGVALLTGIPQCDAFAAHPADPERPDDVRGVPDESVDVAQAIAACAMAVRFDPDEPRLKFQLARALIFAERLADAVELLGDAAQEEHGASLAYLGDLVLYGPFAGDEADPAKAQRLYERAAEEGFAPARALAADIVADAKPATEGDGGGSGGGGSGVGGNVINELGAVGGVGLGGAPGDGGQQRTDAVPAARSSTDALARSGSGTGSGDGSDEPAVEARGGGGGYRPPPPPPPAPVFRPPPAPTSVPRTSAPQPSYSPGGGGGGSRGGPSVPPASRPVFGPGSNPSFRSPALARPLPPQVRPNAPITAHPSFTRQVTPAGKPIMRVGERLYQVPAQGVLSTRAQLLSSTSLIALKAAWTPERAQATRVRLDKLTEWKPTAPRVTEQPIVLGHYRAYVFTSAATNAKRFTIPTAVWDKMTPDEQWKANQRFLDRAIRRGVPIQLATPAERMRKGSFYERELEYLRKRGYRVSADGKSMVRG